MRLFRASDDPARPVGDRLYDLAMSDRSVIVSVLVALMMVGLWKLTSALTRTTDEGPTPLLVFDPASVDRIEVRPPGGEAIAIERAEILGTPRWMVRWTVRGQSLAWPADEGAVRAGLRVLSTSTLDPRPPGGPLEGGSLELTLADGSTRTLRFGDRPLAGRVEIETVGEGGGRGLADAALYDAFVRSGLLAWRDGRVLPSFAAGPSRVELESPSGALALARRQGRWSMLEPLSTEADADAARALLASLGSMTAERFEADADPASENYGFAAPLATVVAETDYRVRTGDAARAATLRQSMLVGSPVDASGQSVFVLLEWTRPTGAGPPETLVGPLVARVRTDALNKLTTRPEPYIAPIAVAALAASVEHVTLSAGDRRVDLARAGPTWTAGGDDLLPDESQLIDQVLALLTETPADAVRIAEDGRSGVGVRLASGGGTPPVDLRVEAGEQALMVRIGTIEREYDDQAETGAALAELLERLAAPGG